MDKNLQTRQLQQSQHMRQADEAILSITDELETIGKCPEEDSSEWLDKKSVWEVQKAEHQAIRDSLSQLKEKHHRETSLIEAEALSARQKQERLQHRTTKLNGQHERLQSSERHNSEQHAKISERYNLELHYKEQLAHLARVIQDFQYRCRQAWQQSEVLATAFEQQQLMTSHSSLINSRPITPEGDLPGTLPHSASSAAFRFPTFGSPDSHHHPLLSNGNALASTSSSVVTPHRYENRSVSDTRHDGSYRARSTSMLSGNSVYTDFSDQDPAPPMPTRGMIEEMRQHSGSSGSVGSKHGSSSPMSPAGGTLGGGWGSGGASMWKGKGVAGGSPSLGS